MAITGWQNRSTGEMVFIYEDEEAKMHIRSFMDDEIYIIPVSAREGLAYAASQQMERIYSQ